MPFKFDGKRGDMDACVAHMMNKVNPKSGKRHTKDSASAMCASIMRKQEHPGKQNITFEDENKIIYENLPLTFGAESFLFETVEGELKESKDVKVKGTLVKASVSRNGVEYAFEELNNAKFADGVIGLNHSGKAEDIIGHFDPIFNDSKQSIDFNGVISNTPYHPKATEMIKLGLWNKVSLEALVEKAEMDKKTGNVKAHGLEFTGFDIVKTPGIPDASLAIAEAFRSDNLEEVELMAEDIKTPPVETQETAKLTVQENKEPPKVSENTEVVKALGEISKNLLLLNERATKLETQKTVGSKGVVTQTEEAKVDDKIVREKVGGGRVTIYEANPSY